MGFGFIDTSINDYCSTLLSRKHDGLDKLHVRLAKICQNYVTEKKGPG